MKPHLHANACVARWGGVREDYMPIHDFMDSSKAHHADVRHRALLHNSWGIYLCERIFGVTIINSDGREVSVRDIAENHVLEDLGTIPSVTEYLREMPIKKWMGGKERRSKKIYRI